LRVWTTIDSSRTLPDEAVRFEKEYRSVASAGTRASGGERARRNLLRSPDLELRRKRWSRLRLSLRRIEGLDERSFSECGPASREDRFRQALRVRRFRDCCRSRQIVEHIFRRCLSQPKEVHAMNRLLSRLPRVTLAGLLPAERAPSSSPCSVYSVRGGTRWPCDTWHVAFGQRDRGGFRDAYYEWIGPDRHPTTGKGGETVLARKRERRRIWAISRLRRWFRRKGCTRRSGLAGRGWTSRRPSGLHSRGSRWTCA